MKEPRLEPDSPAHGVISYDARIAADTDVSASSYASTVSSMPVESLEVREQPVKAQVSAPMTDNRFKTPFSRRKAAVVSLIITVLVVLLTGGALAVVGRESKQPNTSPRLNLNSQDVELKNQSNATAPAELQGAGSAVLINGDLITRGQLKVTNGAYVTVLRSANLTSNRNLTLPNASGMLCVDSNNCGYATAAQLQDLQSRLGQIVVPAVPDATTVNGLSGAVSVQGTSNQVSVTTANGVIALSTPQDIAPISSPTFANLLLNGNFSIAGTVTLPLNCSGMLNGGALTTNASGQIICSADDSLSGGAGGAVTTAGGTSGKLALFTAADTIADSIISQSLGAITIGGNTSVSGTLSANSLTLATALSVANGGTGATTFTTNGVLVGNGTGAVTSTSAPGAGQVLLGNASNVPQFTTVSGDVVISAAGVTAIQADSVALGVDTTGNYVANLGALTGLTASGNTGEGSTPSLSVVYGSTANTSVQGNTSISVTAGTNLTGGGNITLGSGGAVTLSVASSPTFSGNVTAQGGTVTIGTTSIAGFTILHDGNGQAGALSTTDLTSNRTYTFPDASGTVCLSTGNCVGGGGGAPNAATYLTISNDGTLANERAIAAGTNIGFTDGGANGNFTISTVNNPSFSASVTTPLLQSSGALSITPSGALTVGATGQTALLQGSTATITSNGAGNDIVLTSADQIRLTGFNCTTYANGGVLTTDVSGNITCADDDGGAGGAVTGSGSANRVALFTGSQTMADSWMLQNGSTLELDNTRNLSLLGGNLSVTGTGSFSGLLTASGGLTVTSGQTFTVNGDVFTDLTGTGLVVSSGSLQTTLGTSVDLASEITGTLSVTNGGTGVNGSTAANGQLLIGNGTGYTLATLTQGAGITITNAAGSITVANAFGSSIDLGTETTGNYQAGTTAGNGISVSGSAGAGWTAGVALGDLTSNWTQNGAFDIVLNNANSQLKVLESVGGTYFGSIDVGDLTANRTYTFPDASGTICLSTGNCAGAGGGITGSGTTDTIAKFTSGGGIGDSSISDDGSTVTLNGTANLVVQGGTATFGTLTQAGTLTISDGSSNTVSIVASAFSGNQTYTIPDVGGAATFCMSTGNCVGGGGGGAPNDATYLVASLNGTLTNERALNAGSNINLTDGGAGGNFTVATVQNPIFTASVTTPQLQSSGALTLVSAAGQVIAVDAGTTIELQDSTNVTGSVDVSVALNVGTADAFQVNSGGAIAAATGITSSGTITFSAFDCTTFTNGGKLTTNASGQLVCANDNNSAAGTVTGSGTTGTLPIFTASNVIADSIVTQSGTTVNIAGDLTLNTALSVANGGTGGTSFTANGLLYGNGSGALQVTAAGTSGQVLVANASGVPTFVSFSGDVTVSATGATTIAADSVALGTDTTGNYVASLGTLTGLTATGNTGEGSTPTLSVNYGSTANTAVEGNKTIVCPSGTGNLSGGGDTITLGTGGTCSNLDTVTNPTFSTSVTTPLLQSATSLAINGPSGVDIHANSPGNGAVIAFYTGAADEQTFRLDQNGMATFTAINAFGGYIVQDASGTDMFGVVPGATGADGASVYVGEGSANNNSVTQFILDTKQTAGDPTGSQGAMYYNSNLGKFRCYQAGSWVDCIPTAGAAATLQTAYNASTNPEIVVDSTRGALTVRDNSTPLGANLLEVQNNAGTTTYLAVSAAGTTINGTLGVTGNTTITGTGADALTVKSSGNGSGVVVLNVQQSDGDSVLRMTDTGTLAVGNGTNVAGVVAIGKGSGSAFGEIHADTISGIHIYQLPDMPGTICVDGGNCGTTTGTLQKAYDYSVGGTTPEIKLDSGRLGLDIQDGDTTLGAGANFLSFRGSNASGLGSLLVGFGLQGNLYMNPSTDRTDFWDINDQAGNNLFTLDSSNKRVGINLGGSNLPSYTLDVGGTARITGATLIQPATNVANALDVKNDVGTSVLTVDTSSLFVRVSGAGTDAGITSGTGAIQIGADNGANLALDNNEIMARSNGAASTLLLQQEGGGFNSRANTTVFRNFADSTTALQVQNANGNAILTVDTTNRGVGINGGATGALTVTSDLSLGARSGSLLSVSQANDATNNSTAPLVSFSNSDTASGVSVLDLTQGNGNATALQFNANLNSGSALRISGNGSNTPNANVSFATGASPFSGSYINVNPARHLTSGTGTYTESGSFLSMTRNNFNDTASGTYAITGDLATLSSNCTQNTGTCTDTSSILSLNQQYANASGAVLKVQGAGAGYLVQVTDTTATAADVFTIANEGATVFKNRTNSAAAFQVQNNAGAALLGVDTTNNGFVQIGSSTTDANARMFALDSFNGADESTFTAAQNVNGAMYYNSNLGKFRCYQGGVWVDCVSPTGASTTLQQAYNFSSNPEIVLDATRGALTVRDNTTPLGAGVNLLEVQNNAGTTTYFGLTASALTLGSGVDLLLTGANAYISNPQAQTNSEAFGLNATVSGSTALAVGNSASAAVGSSVAVGYNAAVTAGVGGIAIGANSSVGSTNGIAIGVGATGGFHGTAIGSNASAVQDSISLGDSAATAGQRSIAIGTSASVPNTDSIALGYGATTTGSNQLVIGSSSSAITSVRVGNGVASATPSGFTLQGTSGSGSNIAGASVNIAGGQGTGTGVGGSINLQVSGAGASGGSLNSLTTVASFSSTSIDIGTGAQARTVNLGTGTATQNVTVGSLTTGSTTTIQGGTGNINLNVNQAGAGVTIKTVTNDSSTAFQVQRADGNSIFSVDTANGWVINNGSTHPGNLIENPSFEGGAGFTASGWNFGGQSAIATDSTNAHSGNKVLTTTPNGTLIVVSSYKYLAVAPGDQFYAEIWYKTAAGTNGGSNGGSFSFTYYDKDKVNVGSSSVTNFNAANNSYTRATVSGTVPAGAVYVRLSIAVNSTSTTGTWYMDDFYMAKTSEQAPQLLKNTVDSTAAFQIQNASAATLLNVDTTNNGFVQIGSSATDGNARLFALDSFNGADESAFTGAQNVNGAMYYNSNLGKFRCRQGGVWVDCVSPTGASTTLQQAYNFSTDPEITVDATRGALTVRDNSTPIGANLLEVQNNAGSTTYLGVSTSGISVTGNATVSGTVYAPNHDVATVTGLNLGTTNANSITIGNSANNSAITLQSGTGAINIGTGAQARTVNLGTGAANQTVTVGSFNGSSTTSLQGSTIYVGALPGLTSQSAAINIGNTLGGDIDVSIGNDDTGSTASLNGLNINIGTSTSLLNAARTINIGTTTGAVTTTTVGSQNTTSATTIQSGMGGITLQTAGTTSVTSSSTTAAVFKVRQTAGTTAGSGGQGLLIQGDTANGSANALEVQTFGGTQVFAVNTDKSRVTIGSDSAGNCTGRLCVSYGFTNTTGPTSITNALNLVTLTGSTATTTVVGQSIKVLDTTSVANTIKSLVIDNSGVSNSSATVNSIYSQVTSGQNGTFMQLQNGTTDVLNINNTGATTFRTANDSTTAFQIQNAAGSSLFQIDTTNPGVIPNGSFEATAAGATPAGWAPKIGSGNTVQASTARSIYGAKSMWLHNTGTDAGAKYNITLANGTYAVSFYAYTDSGTSQFGYGYASNGSTETQCSGGGTDISTGVWTRYTCTFTVSGTSGTPYFFIDQNGSSVREIYIDGLQIENASTGVTYNEGKIYVAGAFVNPMYIAPQTDVVEAFKVRATDGTVVLNVDTQNKRIGIGTGSPSADLTFADGANRTINVRTPGSAINGNDLTIQAGSAGGASNNNGGNLILQGGNKTGTGTAGGVLVKNQADGNAAFQVQNASATESLFTANTSARSASGGNVIKIGNSTASTDADLTFLQLDSYAGNPTNNLSGGAFNGSLYYNSSTNKVMIVENGTVKELCNKVDTGCGAAGPSLGKDLAVAETSTSNFVGTMYTFTQQNTGAAGVLSLANAGTSSALRVTATSNASTNNALIFGQLTNASLSGNLLDLRSGSSGFETSKFSVSALGATAVQGSVTVTGLVGASGTSGTAASDVMNITGGTGGTATTGTGGAGGRIVLQTGTGGDSDNVGGDGGVFSLTTGAGGSDNSGFGTGGSGGALTIATGAGGSSNNGSGGAGGRLTLQAGAGGFSTTGGGSGGDIVLKPGSASGIGSNGRVQIGSLSSDAVQYNLVLDTSTATGDSGLSVNGAIYYNAGGKGGASGFSGYEGKFRCYEGGKWKNCLGIRDIVERRWGYAVAQGVATAGMSADGLFTSTMIGSAATGTGATVTVNNQAESSYVQYTTGSGIGDTGGLGATFSASATQTRYLPKLTTRIRTGASITNTRLWAGLSSASLSGTSATITSTALGTQYVGIGYTPGINSGKFICGSGDGSTHTGTDMGITVAADTYYDLIIDSTVSGQLMCSISVNGGAFTTITRINGVSGVVLPASSTNLGLQVLISNQSASKVFNIAYAYLEYQ